jgi:hypothetical protein
MLTVTGRQHLLTRQWADALEGVIVRHPNRSIEPILTLDDTPVPNLHFELDMNPSSDSDEVIIPFRITNVKLSFFPGADLARKWLAAAWACFLQHEALELVTIGDKKTRVLDPHENRGRLDYVFHTGLPFTLTPKTLLAALSTAIPPQEAEELMAAVQE